MKKYLVISIFVIFNLLLGMHFASAGETFQNNLLKVDLYESSLGGVKMTLYTNKPYGESVRVNKKSDSEYVILMPETSNSLTAKPSLRSVSGAVKNVEVKTQQYSGQIKGYTKIVVTTSKPIEISPQVQVLSGAPQISEKEYNELLAQSAKKNTGKTATAQKTVTKPVQTLAKVPAKTVAKASAKPVYVQKPRESVKTITSETKSATTKAVSKKSALEQNVAKSKVVNAPKVSTIKVVKESAKKSEVPVKKVETPKKETVTTTPVAKAPAVQTKTEEAPKAQEGVAPAVTQETQTPAPVATVKPEEKVGPAPVAQTSTIKEPSKLQVYKHMIKNQIQATLKKNNVYTLAGMALIPIILLLLILRVIGKSVNKMKAQKSSFMANLKEKPVKTTDIAGKITDDMNWKEKFKTYTEATKERAQTSAAPENMQESSELDDLFGEDEFPHIQEGNGINPEAVQEQDFYGEVPADNAQPVEDDPSADIYREVDAYYDNLGTDNQAFEEHVAPIANYANEESELDQFGSTISQEQNQFLSDEDISLDELFGADEEEIAPRREDNFSYGVNPLIGALAEEPVALQKDFQVEFSDDFSFDTALMEDENEIVEGLTEELINGQSGASAEEIVTSEFVIDHNKGFYLVDFEDTTALVGHIADEIFVLKKFDKKIEGNLQARMDERKENSINYMTKVGKFKALVEVTPKNMNLLIEL